MCDPGACAHSDTLDSVVIVCHVTRLYVPGGERQDKHSEMHPKKLNTLYKCISLILLIPIYTRYDRTGKYYRLTN